MGANRTAVAALGVAAVLAATAACGGSSSSSQKTAGGESSYSPTAVATATATGQTTTPTPASTPTAAPTPSPTPTPTPAPAVTVTQTRAVTPSAAVPHLTSASAVVQQYYQDITNHDYAAAWALGGSNIAGLSYAQYVAGFATTASISLGTLSEFGASQVQAVLRATQTDGTVKTYQGTYTVANGVLVAASIRQVA